VFSACCFRTYGLTSQERGGAVQTEMSLAQIRSDGLKSEEETFPDVSAALRRGIVKKKGTFEIWYRERWKCELSSLFRRRSLTVLRDLWRC
jgi:hypothetical protein